MTRTDVTSTDVTSTDVSADTGRRLSGGRETVEPQNAGSEPRVAGLDRVTVDGILRSYTPTDSSLRDRRTGKTKGEKTSNIYLFIYLFI